MPFDTLLPAALHGALADQLPAPSALAFAALTLVAAYTIFALVGFGSAMVASGPLAAVMPVPRIIPLLALLDCAGAAGRGCHKPHRP